MSLEQTLAEILGELRAIRRLLDRGVTLPRASDLLATVAALLGEKSEWRAAEIRDQVAARGIIASIKQVNNALGYLTRRGNAVRLGYGRYTTPHLEVERAYPRPQHDVNRDIPRGSGTSIAEWRRLVAEGIGDDA